MNKMWEIKEKFSDYKSDEKSAYECGFEDGYIQAIRDIKFLKQSKNN